MARGGARTGAGRKPGAATKKTRAIADKAAAEGLTPLEVMLRAMKEHADAERWDEAAEVAKDAAPYVHPKLAAIEHSGPNGGALPPAAVNVYIPANGRDQAPAGPTGAVPTKPG